MPSTHGATISLCLIVRNEERHLADCLGPVAALFDEIVIVDTGSTDRTREIALQFTEKVHDFHWNDDFAAARNESLRHSRGEWIFWLDADDRIPAPEVEKLAALLKDLGHQKRAYLMTTVSRSQFESEGLQHISHIRLFHRDPQLRWKGRVHEQLRPDLQELGYEMAVHDLLIEHLGYADGAQRLKKAQRDIRLLRMDYAADPEDASTLLHLALAYGRVGSLAEARKYLLTLEALNKPLQDWHIRLYELLSEFSSKLGEIPAAIDYATRGLALFPDEISLLYARAVALHEIDDYKAAALDLQKIERLPLPRKFFGGNLGEIKKRWAPLMLAECWRALGRHAENTRMLTRLVARNPGDVRMLYSLGLSHIASGRRQHLPAVRQRIELLPQGEIFSLLLHIHERFAAGELDHLGGSIETLIHLAPQMPHARILRVEYLRRIDAKLVDYLAACRDALRLNPNHAVIREHIARAEKFLEQAGATV